MAILGVVAHTGAGIGRAKEGEEKMHNQEAVCKEIMEIMREYAKQSSSPYGVDTPGGLEHMGDVWRLLSKWDRWLRGSIG